jgi:hypothetical protein
MPPPPIAAAKTSGERAEFVTKWELALSAVAPAIDAFDVLPLGTLPMRPRVLIWNGAGGSTDAADCEPFATTIGGLALSAAELLTGSGTAFGSDWPACFHFSFF